MRILELCLFIVYVSDFFEQSAHVFIRDSGLEVFRHTSPETFCVGFFAVNNFHARFAGHKRSTDSDSYAFIRSILFHFQPPSVASVRSACTQ